MKTIIELFLILGSLFVSFSGFAYVMMKPKALNVTSEVKFWRLEIDKIGREIVKSNKLDDTGIVECVQAHELPGAFLCLSFFQLDLNRIFGRMSLYAEGGYKLPRKSLVSMKHPEIAALNLTVQGHDLKSADLEEFFVKMLESCKQGKKALCLTKSEQQFYNNIYTPIAKQYKKFVILGFSYQAFDTYQSNVGHEMMHAQYFLEPQYAHASEDYWNTLDSEEKAEIRKALAAEGYDPQDEALMINEFQAFVLEPGAEDDRLGTFAKRHKDKLSALFANKNISPIQIQ